MITRLFEIPERQKKLFAKNDSLVGKENGEWKAFSTDQFIDTANQFSRGLLAMGFHKGDTIGLSSNNRPEWNMADIGMLQVGVINVPIYTTLSGSEMAFILNDASVRIMLVGDESLFKKVNQIRQQVPTLTEIYSFQHIPGCKHWSEILEKGSLNKNPQELDQVKTGIQPNDLATLLYTSGTTGTPKGVMLSHNNILSNVLASEHLCPVDHRHKALSFLPLCHSYERMLTYVYMYIGVSIYYAESIEKVGDNLREIKPHVFSTVPRLLEKVYDRIVARGKELTGFKKLLFFWALNLGLKYELKGRNGALYEQALKLANKLIFNKWREALGGQVRVIVSGGAALQPRLARIFWSARIPVLEGYGLTETSPVMAVNTLEKDGTMFGTVGKVIKDVQVKIAEDGEILCKGPNVMLGYFKKPELTAEVIDADGWFHTGDIGVIQDGLYLKITDRKKEIFKTSGGKYIAPQAIENKFKESPFIEQLMVIGENRKFPAALIVPDFAHLKKWCSLKEIPYSTNAEMMCKPEVIARIQEEVDEFNRDFGQTEQIKKFELLSNEWTVDSGELTATLKLKRKVINEKYKAFVEKIYTE